MYKVLLVDDEYFSREALKIAIPWEECGSEICGEAKNGFDGIDKALELRPDIILTDINMPFMDGLEMIRQLKETMPEVLYCIITGYGEFEYARQGIALGVEDYILKPVDDKEMLKTVRHMVQVLDERKKKQQEFESLQFWAEKNSVENRDKFLDMVLMNGSGISEEKFAHECEWLDVPLQSGGYLVCCLKIDSRTYVHFSQEEWQEKMTEFTGPVGENCGYIAHYQGDGNLYLIFYHMAEEKAAPLAEALMRKVQIRMMQEWVCTVMAGVGTYCSTYQEIAASREQAEASVRDITVSKLIQDTLTYINGHYVETDLSLKEISENLFVNYSYLSTQFKKEIGMSVSQYIVRSRMAKAADALRSGERNMVEIATAVGYTDIKYFYRCFKKEFGITTYQYIEILKKTGESKEVF